MYLRFGVFFPAVLAAWTAIPAAAPQSADAIDPAAALAAIELPGIAGEIEAPAVLAVGQAEIRPSAGARVFLMSAAGRTCGVLIDGPASLTYRVRDRFSIPLARRNASRGNGLSVRESPNEVTLSGSLRSAAVWGWNLDVASGSLRPAPGASLPEWLDDLLKSKLETNPGRDMLLSSWNGDAGFRWALLRTSGDDLMLDVDPRPAVLLESIGRVRRLARNSGPFAGSWTTEELVSQPIDRMWWQAEATDFAAVDSEIEVRNASGNHVVVRTRSRLQSFRDDLRALSLSLVSESVRSSGERHPFKIIGLTVDGTASSYVHHRDHLLVLVPRALRKNESTVVETTVEGEILERPQGDNYWQLGDEPWYPRPFVGGVERAAFRISVETSAPFVPFAPGELVQRDTTGPARKVVTRLNGPMERLHVIAGKYSTFSEEADGSRIHVSTYATGRKDDALRIAKIAHGVRGCLTDWLGVPYPFQDLQILEITDWGWGQAPPGLIFVTQEAFLTRARAGTLDEQSTFIAGQVSRGINERVAHEVAHAWFPHVAKIDRREENWLSESLADYTSVACLSQLDNRGGKARFSRQLSEWKYLVAQLSASTSIYLASHLGRREVDWRDRQALLYAKGPLVLQAIRQELARLGGTQQEGDRLFFAWLRSYIKNFTFKTAETRHLIGILNQITKKDWQPWFERYVYGAEAVPLD
jgi:Peptidase family M1 domain